MGNFRYKIAQFMTGRHGMDQLSRDLMAYGMIIVVADIFIPGNVATYIGYFLVFFAIYRIFSRNNTRMTAQLYWYKTYVDNPLRSFLNRNRKHYRYFKCPSCKQVQKAPRGRGRIRVTCHKCGNVFEKRV